MGDLYSILGVAPDASTDEIRGRYRFLAQAFHPDKFLSVDQKQQAEEEFKKINTSHQTVWLGRRLIGGQNRVNLFLRQNQLLGDAHADQPTVSYLDATNL